MLRSRYEFNSAISTCSGNLERFNLQHNNEQLLNVHIMTPQIPTSEFCKAPSTFQDSYNVKYFKVIKPLKKGKGVFTTQASIFDRAFL